MSNIASAFLGAIIGGLFSLLGTWLTLRGRTDYFDDMALKQLKDMLDKDKDASMTQLLAWGKAIGMSEAETRQLIFLAKSSLGYQVRPDTDKAKKSKKAL